MMNQDVEPASSEPNSISPVACDVGRWEIDLRNLRSGERMDFSVPHYTATQEQRALRAEELDAIDLASLDGLPHVSPGAHSARSSHLGRNLMGAMTAMLLVVGLGFVALRGKPAMQHALASSDAKSSIAETTPAGQAGQAAPVVVAAAPVPAPPPAPVVAAASVAPSPPAVATLSAADLPNAKAKGSKWKKRANKQLRTK
jgi:hypothetical protein